MDKDEKLVIKDTKVGTGPAVKEGNTIVVHYKGYFPDGKQFDSSYDRKEPFSVQIGAGYVIRGWDEGIVGMQTGGKRTLTVPYTYGYGKYGMGNIPGFATLLFDIELLEIK